MLQMRRQVPGKTLIRKFFHYSSIGDAEQEMKMIERNVVNILGKLKVKNNSSQNGLIISYFQVLRQQGSFRRLANKARVNYRLLG